MIMMISLEKKREREQQNKKRERKVAAVDVMHTPTLGDSV
jgi:hypothetical protein